MVLKNGDRVTGKIVGLGDGTLVVKSDQIGEVKIAMKDVATFQSDSPLETHLKDGTVIHQPVVAADPNQFGIAQGPALRPQTFSLPDVAAINPPPKPEPKWEGSVSGAVSSTHGDTKAEAVSASVSVSRRSEKGRTTAGADYGKTQQRDRDSGEDKTTEDWWRARAEYDYFFTKRFFGFINSRYEKDAIANLD